MNKFFTLLKKEIKELLTPLILLPLLITVFVFYGIGKVGSSEIKKASHPPTIMVIDQDNSTLSEGIISTLKQANFGLLEATNNPLSDTKNSKGAAYLVIPQGFGAGIASNQPQQIEVHAILTNLSVTGLSRQQQIEGVIDSISKAVSQQVIASQTKLSYDFIQNPINIKNFVAVGDKEAQTSLAEVSGYIQSQTYFIPLIIFVVIIFASQLIATSIASEKENKTLETLLSVPVSRQSIVLAKLSAAAILALLFSLVYMVSFRSYINGFTGELGVSGSASAATSQALIDLGLKLGWQQYLLLGATLFVGIASGLTVALILGAFAEDVKSIQAVITPLMILLMIPYILSTFTDISTASPAVKWLLYAIPFSHPFLAINFLSQHQYAAVGWGIAYQLVFFVLAVYVASRLFSSDHIISLKLSFGRKRR